MDTGIKLSKSLESKHVIFIRIFMMRHPSKQFIDAF